MKVQIIEPSKQKVWGWPATANFILGGAAAGFYILCSLIIRLNEHPQAVSQTFVPHFLPILMVALGFACLTVEVGRPLRGHYVLRRLFISRMSQEALAAGIFVFAVILNWLFPNAALFVIAVMAGMALLFIQGSMVHHARAITAWNAPIIPLLFVTSSFATGGGLLLVCLKWSASGLYAPLIGFTCTCINLSVWLFYLHWSRDPAFRKATESLRSLKYRILIVGIGHLMPLIVLFSALVAPGVENGVMHTSMIGPAMGLAMIIGSGSQKAAVVLGAGNQRDIGLSQNTALHT